MILLFRMLNKSVDYIGTSSNSRMQRHPGIAGIGGLEDHSVACSEVDNLRMPGINQK